MYRKVERIHLVGAGGIGVSSIAELLVRHGYKVSGSDLRKSETVRRLESLGVQIFLGHNESNIKGADLIVHSSAIKEDNPELVAAKENRILTITRAEMLAELMRLKYGIAVAGAHGKTTTTSIAALVLQEAGLDPTVVVGGRMDNFGGTNARMGNGSYMVTEADESDGSFNKLNPSIAVVTNLDREHMEFYRTMRRLKSAFLSFLNKVPFYGLSILCGDDPHLRLMYRRVDRRKVSYGFKEYNDYHIADYQSTERGSRSKINYKGTTDTLNLNVPGKHNLLNALAALAVADELSISRKQSLEALAAFEGVQRRFQKKGSLKGVLFIDDYAHHPTEIQATLAAAREQFPKSKIRVVFQPHRFSRVEDLFQEFSSSFHAADAVCVTDIYAAGENTPNELQSDLLVENMQRLGMTQVKYVPNPQKGIETLLEESKPGDVVFTFGAGDIVSVYRDLF